MDRRFSNCRWAVAAACLSLSLLACTGCTPLVGLISILNGAHTVPAEFELPEDQRIAVVCVSQSGSFGPSTVASMIANRVTMLLNENLGQVRLIEQQAIDDWRDHNGWDAINYRELGRGVDADIVVAIDLESFSLHEGQTLLRGEASAGATVYDMTTGGKIVKQWQPKSVRYPKTTGYYAGEMSEVEFRRAFVDVIARQIARRFYRYEIVEDVAIDRVPQ